MSEAKSPKIKIKIPKPKPKVDNDDLVEALRKLAKAKYKEATDLGRKDEATKKAAQSLRFKGLAYNKAADSIDNYILPILSGKEAQRLPGIGKSIADKIDELLTTGDLSYLVAYDSGVVAVEDLKKVYGIGDVFAGSLVKEGITTVKELRKAFKEETVKLNNKQKIGLKYCDDFQKRIPYDEIEDIQTAIRKHCPETKYEFIIAGSHRRKAETSGDIDILLTGKTNRIHEMVAILTKKKLLIEDLALGDHKYMGVIKLKPKGTIPRRIDIIYRNPESYYPAIIYFTGSKEFNVRMRNVALGLGYSLNEDGLFISKGRDVKGKIIHGERIKVDSEQAIFDLLGMVWVEPEER